MLPRPHPADSPSERLAALAAKVRADPTLVYARSEDSDEHGTPRRRFRLPRVPRRGLLALGVAVACTVIGLGSWWQSPAAEPAPALALVSTTAPAPELVVNVVGEVTTPGLVTVTSGARVADAVRLAGGIKPGTDLHNLNLARKLTDGEQIAVGIPPPAGPAAVPSKLDLNSATASELDALPGVGPVTAQRIVDHRTRKGPFASVDQLREVEGIGDSKLAKLADLVHT
ncbi:helix-hairpin-helix domain-containing protein [Lentzea flava]|uniref:Competence protein ComEA n=1 Tax=Lentzea flava TaxID=103732 RepID=A0ABQ2VAS9_9PSEU|nr:ComEA family DNA-binding protein [Lentzea flava]MCP2204223.1 competence protein ComEA [Lentzea flava]GGU75544.1 competence protein ComEA [Lentzea flava]